MWLVTFRVQGAGTFPMDMLRYDTCFPATSDDCAKLLCHNNADYLEDRILTMVKLSRTKVDGPTVRRWASFGWACAEFSARKMQ